MRPHLRRRVINSQTCPSSAHGGGAHHAVASLEPSDRLTTADTAGASLDISTGRSGVIARRMNAQTLRVRLGDKSGCGRDAQVRGVRRSARGPASSRTREAAARRARPQRATGSGPWQRPPHRDSVDGDPNWASDASQPRRSRMRSVVRRESRMASRWSRSRAARSEIGRQKLHARRHTKPPHYLMARILPTADGG